MNQEPTNQMFSDFLECAYDAAARIYKESDEVSPVILVLAADESGRLFLRPISVAHLQTDDAGKDGIAFLLRSVMEHPSVVMAGYLSEAWSVVQAEDAPGLACSPSDHPDRVEMLVVTLLSKSRQFFVATEIDRTGDRPRFERTPIDFGNERMALVTSRFEVQSATRH